MILQFYDDDRMIRAFPKGNGPSLFDVRDVDWRKLDALGLPRISKKGWTETDWGWEIEAALVPKNTTG
jgi:hypothetical protein